MNKPESLSIVEFAELAGVSNQAIYKQVRNENSQIAPYLLRVGKRTRIKVSALQELYGVDIEKATRKTKTDKEKSTDTAPKGKQKTESKEKKAKTNTNIEQQSIAVSTQESPPFLTDYIAFLKAQLAEAKEEKKEIEQRLNATIQEKDKIIKDQSAQLAQLAQQVAQIADKALITTAQQQYLTARAGGDAVEITPAEEVPIEEQPPEKKKKGFWSRLFGG